MKGGVGGAAMFPRCLFFCLLSSKMEKKKEKGYFLLHSAYKLVPLQPIS